MAIKFTTTADSSDTVNVLVYGESGLGKTVLGATAPNPIIISSERGLMSIAEHDIPVIEVSSLDDFNDAYIYIRDKGIKQFDTVVLDSISDIAEAALSELLRTNKDGRKAYGTLNTEIAGLIRKFRDLDMNAYFIAKAQTYESASGLTCLQPAMPGKTLVKDLPYFFDIVLVLRIKEIEDPDDSDRVKKVRYLQTERDLTYEAKDRSNKLAPIEEPNLTKLFAKIGGGTNVKKKKKKKK